jgi:hypothetical protein
MFRNHITILHCTLPLDNGDSLSILMTLGEQLRWDIQLMHIALNMTNQHHLNILRLVISHQGPVERLALDVTNEAHFPR